LHPRYRPDLLSVLEIELSTGAIVMNKFGVALAALSSLVATPILAADLAVKAPPPPPPPVATWTSCYVGVEAGYGWGRTHDSVAYVPPGPFAPLPPYTTAGTNLEGAMGGPQVGCDYQWGTQWVVGVIATYDFADISGSNTTAPVPGFPLPIIHTFHEEIDGFGTVRGRIGWLFAPNWLVYGSGGLAYGRVVTSAVTSGPGIVGTVVDPGEATWKTGWTAGGGVEWKFSDHISVFAEYLYAELGSVTGRGELEPTVFGGAEITDSYDRPKVNVVKAGINWHFP
jgi:outer membrane immunogenic protein